MTRTVLLTGATGCVGSHVLGELQRAGWRVRLASRQPRPGWTLCDLDQPRTLAPALQGCDAAVYLVHGLGRDDFEARDPQRAEAFARVAAQVGVGQVVYLGGMQPAGQPSPHLHSRLQTGQALAAHVPTVELRAGMVVAAQSASWRLVRDVAVRMPVLTLPAWLGHRSQPVAVTDVAAVLAAAVARLPAGTYDLPGPETLTARDILRQTGQLAGRHPPVWNVPWLSPDVAALGALVSRTDVHTARQLLHSLSADIVQTGEDVWPRLMARPRLGFAEATRRALAVDRLGMPMGQLVVDTALATLLR